MQMLLKEFLFPSLLWIATCGLATAQVAAEDPPKFSGRFTSKGTRWEVARRSASRSAEDPDALEKSCKSIDEWAELATKARSKKFRKEAADALNAIAASSRIKADNLTAPEADNLRSQCKALISHGEHIETMLRALVFIPDASCVPIFQRYLGEGGFGNDGLLLLGLGSVKDDTAIKVIEDYLAAASPNGRNRSYGSALVALRKIDTPRTRAILEDIFKNSPHAEIRESAAEQLDQLDAAK
jgi:hypothetical protein